MVDATGAKAQSRFRYGLWVSNGNLQRTIDTWIEVACNKCPYVAKERPREECMNTNVHSERPHTRGRMKGSANTWQCDCSLVVVSLCCYSFFPSILSWCGPYVSTSCKASGLFWAAAHTIRKCRRDRVVVGVLAWTNMKQLLEFRTTQNMFALKQCRSHRPQSLQLACRKQEAKSAYLNKSAC